METRQEDSIQQLLLQMRQEHANELRRMEESREADLRMMRDRFEDLVLRQETGKTRGSQDLAGGRTNFGGSWGSGLLQATGSRTWTPTGRCSSRGHTTYW